MAMITDLRELQTPVPDAPTMEPPVSHQALVGWLVVALALVAATVLAALVLTGGDDPAEPRPWYSVERGSITAIDHAAEASQVTDLVSITAIDHAAATPSAARPWYSTEHGSTSAIDHATASRSQADVSADRGSITAIDHAAENEATEGDTTGTG
jgi:hypothetical protein